MNLFDILNKIEKLEKASKKDYHPMMGDSLKHVADFAHENIDNANHGMWYLRNIKKNPELHTVENQTKIKHFNSVGKLKELQDLKLGNESLEQGFQKMDEAERKGYSNLGEKALGIQKHFPKHEKLIDFGNGIAWYKTNQPKLAQKISGPWAGHCGNCAEAVSSDNLYILGKEKVPGQIEHLSTFVNNNGYLGEMKGNQNWKPSDKYHKYITKLLEHPDIKGVVGGGHAYESNFDREDLDDSEAKRIENMKGSDFFHPYIEDLPKKFQENYHHKPEIRTRSGSDDIDTQNIDTQNIDTQNIDEQREIINKQTDPESWTMQNLAYNKNLHPDLQREIINKQTDPDSEIIQNLAENKNLHPDLQREIINKQTNPSSKTMQYLAENKNLHPDLQREIINQQTDPDSLTMETLSRNASLHPDIQREIINKQTDPDSWAIRMLAQKQNLHQDIQREIFNKQTNPSSKTMRYLAANKNLHPDLHKEIINKQTNLNSEVIQKLAENKNLHPNLQREIINQQTDPNSSTMQTLAQNKNLHHDIQREIINKQTDPDSYTMQNLAYNKNLHHDIQREIINKQTDPTSSTMRNLAENKNLHPDIQREIINKQTNPDSDTMQTLAENKNLHPDIQREIINKQTNPDSGAMQYLADNKNLHPNIQLEIINKQTNPNSYTIKSLAQNENLHPDLQKEIINKQTDLDSDTMRYLAENGNLHPDLQKEIFNKTGLYPRAYLLNCPKKEVFRIMNKATEEDKNENNKVYQNSEEAANAVEERRKIELDKALSPEGSYDKLLIYKDSHDPNIRKRARKELERRKLNKSNVFNMIDKLQKIYQINGVYYPSQSDKDGMDHPTNPNYHKATAINGKAVWANKPHVAKKQEYDIKQAYTNLTNNRKYSNKTINHIRSLARHVVSSPDMHVIGSGTEPNAEKGYKEMRLRHLLHAMTGREGYSITPTQNGIKVVAKRHPSNRPPEITTWHWDGKELISNGKKIKKNTKVFSNPSDNKNKGRR